MQLAKGAQQAAMLGLSKWETPDQALIWGILPARDAG